MAHPIDQPPARPPLRRRQLAVVALCVVATLVLAELVAYIAAPRVTVTRDWGMAELDARVEQMAGLGDADVVFIGSSVVAKGIDPTVFGTAHGTVAYNAGVNGSSPRLWELWIGEVVEPSLQPDTVVIGVVTHDLNDESLVHDDAYSRYASSDGRSAHIGTQAAWERVLDDSALMRRRGELRSPSTWWPVLGLGDGATQLPLTVGGYDTTDRQRRYEPPTRTMSELRLGGTEAAALEATLRSLAQHRIDTYVVLMPVVERDHLSVLPGGEADHVRFTDMVRTIADERGATVLDARNVVTAPDHFVDHIHLNGAGTDMLSHWLAAEIAAQGV